MVSGFNGHKSVTGSICYSTEHSPCLETRMPPNVIYPDIAQSLTARHDSSPCIDRSQNFIAIENYPADSRLKLSGDVVQTLSSWMGTGGNNEPMVLCVPIDLRQAVKNSANGDNSGLGVGDDGQPSFTITKDQPHAVFTIGNGQPNDLYYDEKARTLNCMRDQQVLAVQKNEIKCTVRRLTPTECTRLQGFPDFWAKNLELTDISEKTLQRWAKKDRKVPKRIRKRLNKWIVIFETHRCITDPKKKPKTRNQIVKWLKNPHSDSAEYKMWGNGIALPCAYNVLAGIAEELRNAE